MILSTPTGTWVSTTFIKSPPRSKRIQTRTKGKRKLRRLAREAAEAMRSMVEQEAMDLWRIS